MGITEQGYKKDPYEGILLGICNLEGKLEKKEENMKIAISSTGRDLDSQIDPRFGRCPFFVIVETEDMGYEAFDNESISLSGGAGIQAAQFVASAGIKAVITGNAGPNAMKTLSASGVEVYTGQSGTVREAVEQYKKGGMSTTGSPNVDAHYGMGSGAGMGRGMGMGRGGGMGRGMGMGSGRGMGRGMSGVSGRNPDRASGRALSKEEELKRLKDQEKELREKIRSIESSIDDPENQT